MQIYLFHGISSFLIVSQPSWNRRCWNYNLSEPFKDFILDMEVVIDRRIYNCNVHLVAEAFDRTT